MGVCLVLDSVQQQMVGLGTTPLIDNFVVLKIYGCSHYFVFLLVKNVEVYEFECEELLLKLVIYSEIESWNL